MASTAMDMRFASPISILSVSQTISLPASRARNLPLLTVVPNKASLALRVSSWAVDPPSIMVLSASSKSSRQIARSAVLLSGTWGGGWTVGLACSFPSFSQLKLKRTKSIPCSPRKPGYGTLQYRSCLVRWSSCSRQFREAASCRASFAFIVTDQTG